MQAQAAGGTRAPVEERTADLARVNSQIEAEIAERRLTEQQLRQTQADLIQAGKLAASGRCPLPCLTTFNQPLPPPDLCRQRALLIERGRTAEAERQCPADFGLDRPYGLDQPSPAQLCGNPMKARARFVSTR